METTDKELASISFEVNQFFTQLEKNAAAPFQVVPTPPESSRPEFQNADNAVYRHYPVSSLIADFIALNVSAPRDIRSLRPLKTTSIRLRPDYLALIDKLASNFSMNRQKFLSSLIVVALDSALDAYTSVFDDPALAYKELCELYGVSFVKPVPTPDSIELRQRLFGGSK